MIECILEDIDRAFPKRAFLTLDEVAELLCCERNVVYNWTRRPDVSRRPPAFMVGKDVRFPKNALVRWLVEEQLLGAKIG